MRMISNRRKLCLDSDGNRQEVHKTVKVLFYRILIICEQPGILSSELSMLFFRYRRRMYILFLIEAMNT